MSSQVLYMTDKVDRIPRQFSGSGTITAGMPVCFTRGDGSATTPSSYWAVDEPATATLGHFAGVVDDSLPTQAGPRQVNVLEPRGVSSMVQALVYGNVTQGVTYLKLADGDGYFVVASSVSDTNVYALAQQTKNCNTTGGNLIWVELLSNIGSITLATVEANIADPGTGVAIPVTASGHCDLVIAAAGETNTIAVPASATGALDIIVSAKSVAAGTDRTVTVAGDAFDGVHTKFQFTAAAQAVRLFRASKAASYAWKLINFGATLSAFIIAFACLLASPANAQVGPLAIGDGNQTNTVLAVGQFGKLNSDGNMIPCTAATDAFIGIVTSSPTSHKCGYAPSGSLAWTMVEGAPSIGDFVTADSNGFGVTVSTGGNVPQIPMARIVQRGADPNGFIVMVMDGGRTPRGLFTPLSMGNANASPDANNTPGTLFTIEANMPSTGVSARLLYTVPAGKHLRVLDAVIYKNQTCADANNTILLLNGTNAITDARSLALTDKYRAAFTSIDYTYQDIAAAGTLNVTTVSTGGLTAGCKVIVTCCWIP
jgi:hypothetical protein